VILPPLVFSAQGIREQLLVQNYLEIPSLICFVTKSSVVDTQFSNFNFYILANVFCGWSSSTQPNSGILIEGNLARKADQKYDKYGNGAWLLAFRFLLLAFGFWLLAFGFWLLAFGFCPLAFGFWLLAFGSCELYRHGRHFLNLLSQVVIRIQTVACF